MRKNNSSPSITKAELTEMKDFEQRMQDAMGRKDLDAVMECFWNDPDLVFVFDGVVFRGHAATRSAVKELFDQNESVRVKTNEVTHLPSGDGVIAVGTATYYLKPANGQRQLMVERWTDLRRKIDGRWVMVLDHTTNLPE